MSSSIRRLISLDHERLLRLLRRTVTEGPSQQRWLDELVQLLGAHRDAEDRTLTPDVVTLAGPSTVAATETVARIATDLDQVTGELAARAIPSGDLADLGDRLRGLLEEHADVLSSQVLVPLEAAVPRKEIRRLGGVYEQLRDETLHAHGAVDPPPRRLDLSRAELYELARRAGIEGRSGMSRGDLIAELQRRQAHP
jgi:hypothetical protein